jgi:hypothetical protein
MKTVVLSLCLTMLVAPAITRGATDPTVQDVLLTALAGPDGEYAAFAEYSAIIEKHGAVAPYVNIRGAETRHINALQRQCEKYGVTVPENTYLGKITAPANLIEAAKQGVVAEERNVAMYDALLAKMKDHPDLTRVFSNLQRCSREMHLPAFQAAAEGKPGVCCGGGMGKGRGPCGGGGQQRRGQSSPPQS